MSKHQKKMEAVLDLLINEEAGQAAELLHQIIVEKSRDMYEELVDDMDEDEREEDLEESEGDPKADFADDIEADTDEIEGDEEFSDGDSEATDDDEGDSFDAEEGGEEGEEEGELDGEGEVDDRLEDLESALQSLRSEFDSLMADEMQEPEHADLAGDLGVEGGDTGMGGDEFGAETGFDVETEEGFEDGVDDAGKIKSRRRYEEDVYENETKAQRAKRIAEATKLQDQQSGQDLLKAGNKEEGKHVGTGKDSVSGETFKQSPYTSAPSKENYGGKPIASSDGSEGKKDGLPLGKGTPPVDEDNIDVPSKNAAKPSNDAKDDAGARKSPFTQKPKKK